VKLQGIPAAATIVPKSQLPDRLLVCELKATWISASVCRRLPPGHYDGLAARPLQVGRDR